MPDKRAMSAEAHRDGKLPILVLVVDDEPLIRWSLTETLTACGCEVVEAGNAPSAIDRLTRGSRHIDVVLLDYHLPDSRDLALLTTIKRLSPATHVLMMTAFMTADVAARALELGACQVVNKPVELEAVAAWVVKTALTPDTAPPAIRGT